MRDTIKSFFKAQYGELVRDNIWDELDVKKENTLHSEAVVLITENIEDMFNDTVSTLICENTVQLHEKLEKVGKQCNDRIVTVQDMPIMKLTGEKKMLVTDDKVADNSSEHELLLSRNL